MGGGELVVVEDEAPLVLTCSLS